MNLLNLFYSFRVRLLLLLAALLIATLGVEYYLNRQAEHKLNLANARAVENLNRVIVEQEQALAAGVTFALQSLKSDKYLYELQEQWKNPLLEKAGRVTNILLVNEEGRVDDSLDRAYLPMKLEDGSPYKYNIYEVHLPKLIVADQDVKGNIKQFLPITPIQSQPRTGEPRAFVFPIEVNKKNELVINYIVIVLGPANTPNLIQPSQARRPLLPTLAVLLIATLSAAVLLWRFTRPINDLSRAAQRVAAGDFSFRVPAANRRDEIGALAATFNEMITKLSGMRELEARLNQAERSAVVGRLASAIAHEIRNPLNYINLTLDHIRTTLAPEDGKRRELFSRLTDQLKKEVARINTRISEFLKYTRPTKLELTPINLRATLNDALNMVQVQADESRIETRMEQNGPIPTVLGDEESLRSVFTNLIINGMQAMDSGGGQLKIQLSSDNGRARIEITDTGRGIAPDDLPQIFEPYFSTKETGTGLGLAIVKKAVDDHGGSIFVRSKPGEGTTFTVEIPIGEEVRGQCLSFY